jgi:hypothetical protein
MDIYSTITDLVTSSSCCDFLGVADLAVARDFIGNQGGEAVAGFPKAISIGIALTRRRFTRTARRTGPWRCSKSSRERASKSGTGSSR